MFRFESADPFEGTDRQKMILGAFFQVASQLEIALEEHPPSNSSDGCRARRHLCNADSRIHRCYRGEIPQGFIEKSVREIENELERAIEALCS